MTIAIKLLPKLALVVGITAALAFGAKEAAACAACPPPSQACVSETDPDGFCDSYCVQEGCLAGTCRLALDECWCAW